MAGTDLTAWRGKRVLITGHSGFIGTWLSVALTHAGAEVSGFAVDDAPELSALGITSTRGDVRDFDSVWRAMSAAHFDVIFHLAAQPLVNVGLSDPRGTLSTNVGGSINVLEAARLCAPRVLVHVTSDKCYRNREWPWPYREVDELGGGCPYSVSKSAAELIFEAYSDLYRTAGSPVHAASVRFGNVIGGGDRATGRLVPDVVAALRAGEPIRLRRPGAVRPWQHVLDVVHGLLLLAEALADDAVGPGEVFNFAPPGDGATVQELVSALISAWDTDAPVLADSDLTYVEHDLLRLDGRKAAAALSWRHAFDVTESAKAIAAWDRTVSGGVSPIEATSRQIIEFLGIDEQTGVLT